jgi:uncharacterized protein (TIGR03382 family)
MNKMTIATALIASAGAALAGGSHTFDVSGIGVDGGYGDNFGITSLMHDFGSAGKITNISWDLNYESLSPSWQSEMSFSIDTDSGFADFLASDDLLPDSSGLAKWDGSLDVSIDTTDGLVLLTLWEAFDDSAISPDSIFGAGSTITVSFIPAPGAAALLGLGGLVATRRRR